LDKRRRNIYDLLTAYYPQENGKIPYAHLINRMCFWMATGSGKTLVIIKLIQILKALMERGEIPQYDILVLTYRDDLIEQFKKLVAEFNYAGNGIYIRLKELKEYPEVKRQQILFRNEEITVFYYRSDNLSDEQKERIIDFRNYDNDGRWYIFLDEAHKGDKEESKRQHIYSILSRNGFLFNSSATFIDDRDIITCAYEFNLSSFINAGYGKHIAILKQEIRAFRDNENYSDEEKQKIVLKSLILLTYVKSFYKDITKIQKELYHNPLLLTLVNSVNTEDADLKRFFGELERIGKGEIDEGLFRKALDELWEELKQEPDFMFEGGNKVKIEEAAFRNITKKDVLKYIYNAESFGEIEVSFRPSDKKQVAFKLTTTDKHFALTKTGDMPAWLKEELSRFNINHQFEEEGFFERINRDDSPINILMGSRAFYEGWDSNRPNVINYINIGMGEDARKFILQSVGRGVRIEPIKDKRKRLLSLYNAKEIDGDLFHKIKDKALPIESLFIFGTNRDALKTVVERLQVEGKLESETWLTLFDINPKAEGCKLLVPVYKEGEQPIFKAGKQKKFLISVEDFGILNKFSEFVPDDRVLLMRYAEKLKEPGEIRLLRQSLNRESNFYNIGDNRNYKNIDLLTQRIFDYLNVVPKEFEGLKELEEEIRHFKNIKVYLKDISEVQEKIEAVKNYPNKKKKLERELSKLSGGIREEVRGLLTKEATEIYEHNHKRIKIKYVANHYYIPLVLSEDEKVDYVKHIIKTQSEAKFISDLEDYLSKSSNKFREFDWWLFSKLDESLDEVYIPYYNPNFNRISNFYPDFIFWLLKGNDYSIIFVDPKGTEHTSYIPKIDGYREIFENIGEQKILRHNGLKVKIKLLLKPDDVSKIPELYRQYSFDKIETMLSTKNNQ
jgi:type III restriction enzyme